MFATNVLVHNSWTSKDEDGAKLGEDMAERSELVS